MASAPIHAFLAFLLQILHPLTLSQRTNFGLFQKLKEFADDNFKLDESVSKFSKQVENTVGIGEIARYNQFLLFPQCFQKAFTADIKTPACLGRVKVDF